MFPKCLAEFAALSEADGVAAVKSFRGEQTTMEPIIDFLAEEELKAAEKIVMGIFEVKQARHCRPVISRKDARKARKAGKHVRVAELVKDLRAKAAGAGR